MIGYSAVQSFPLADLDCIIDGPFGPHNRGREVSTRDDDMRGVAQPYDLGLNGATTAVEICEEEGTDELRYT